MEYAIFFDFSFYYTQTSFAANHNLNKKFMQTAKKKFTPKGGYSNPHRSYCFIKNNAYQK